MSINPYVKLYKEAQKNNVDKNLIWAYQEKKAAWNEGYMERAKELEQLRAKVKVWIKDICALEQRGKELIDEIYQLQKELDKGIDGKGE